MKTVLIDASSSILLFKAGLYDGLVLYYHVVMAPSVYGEITVPGYPGDRYFMACRQKGLIHIVSVPVYQDPPGLSFPAMGPGEADTISLYSLYPHGFVIMDDGKGARFCKNRKIPYINALLVPKIFNFTGRISKQESLDAMGRICQWGRYSDVVISVAQTLTRDDLAYFIDEIDHDTPSFSREQCMEK